jgi:branched-chain amino acid transport system permease protein
VDWSLIFDSTIKAAVNKEAMVFALAAVGLNLHFGYTGLLNFGQAGFIAIGAYGAAIAVEFYQWSLWAGLASGLVFGVIFALILGVPTLRLRSDYLAIVTIAFAEMIRFVVRSNRFTWFTGGSSGINGFSDDFYALNPFDPGTKYGFGPLTFSGFELWPAVVGWTLVALCSLLVYLLIRSPWGRVLKSIREDEDAARSLGKNVFVYKMQSLVLGGLFGVLAGFMSAVWTRSVQPDTFATAATFFAYTCLILGGVGRVKGPVIGSMIFLALLSFTDTFLRQAVGNDLIPDSIMSGSQVGQTRFILMGVGLMALMIFRPQGIFGNKRELELDAR